MTCFDEYTFYLSVLLICLLCLESAVRSFIDIGFIGEKRRTLVRRLFLLAELPIFVLLILKLITH